MPISRRNKKLFTYRTYDYARAFAQTSGAQPLPAVGQAGANVLFIKPDLDAAVTLASGYAFSFSVSVTAVNSAAPILYQWQTSADGTTWTNVVGAVARVYTRTFTGTDNGLRVRVLISQLLRTIVSRVCQVTVVPPTSRLTPLTGYYPDYSNLTTCFLSGLFADKLENPLSLSRTHAANLHLGVMCSDPQTGQFAESAVGAGAKLVGAHLSTILRQPVEEPEIDRTSIQLANLNTLFSDQLDAGNVFGVTASERVLSFAPLVFSKNVAGLNGANYNYTSTNLPLGLNLSNAGVISGAVISDRNFERNVTLTATHKITSAVFSLNVVFAHSLFYPESAPASRTISPNVTANTGVSYSGVARQLGPQEFLITNGGATRGASGSVSFSNLAIANPVKRYTRALTVSFDFRIFNSYYAPCCGMVFELAPTFYGIYNAGQAYPENGLRVVFDTTSAAARAGIYVHLNKQAGVRITPPVGGWGAFGAPYSNFFLKINRNSNYSGVIEYNVAGVVGSFPANDIFFTGEFYTWPASFYSFTDPYNSPVIYIRNFSLTYE
jgi:hypothetical protein